MKLNVYKINSNIKYKIMSLMYPEIDNIFMNNQFAHTFETADIAHNAYKKLYKYYDKNMLDIKAMYQDYLYKLGCLICDIKYDPSIHEIMYIFGYLLYNGYLSYDNSFKFLFPDKELQHNHGINIMYGTGVCRNIGSMFSDLLDMFDVENYGVMTDRETFDFKPHTLIDDFADFFREDPIYNEQFNKKRIKKKKADPDFSPERGNHFEIIVHHNGWKLYDPTNLCAYRISNEQNKYHALKFIRLWSLYSIGKYGMKETVYLYKLLKEKYLKLYDSDKILDLQQECFDRCEKNKSKIKKFNNSITPNLNYINDIFKNSK